MAQTSAEHNSTHAPRLVAPAIVALFNAVFCSALLGIAGCDASGGRSTMTFATGNPSGIYYPFGGGLASIWSRELNGVNMKAEVTGASMINVIQVARGESEVGIAMGDVVTSAYQGTERFPEPLPIRTLFAAYPNLIHVMARADAGIAQMSDLRGKRVSMGAPGSGTSVAAENVLAGLQIGQQELEAQYLNFSGTADGMKDGVIDAAFVVGGLGIGVVKELALTRDIVLVSLSAEEVKKLSLEHPAYIPEQIPAATYNGVDQVTDTMAIWNLVVVNSAMDDKLAWRLLCGLYQNKAALEAIVPSASFATPENAARIKAVPLHPGAAEFLQDAAQHGLASLGCNS